MKLNDSTRFPHPVLWEVTGDYIEGGFTAGAIKVEEELNSGQVNLEVELNIAQPEILQLIRQGNACAGFIVDCPETYLSRLYPLKEGGGRVALDPGIVSGRVIVRPAVWSLHDVPGFRPAGLHREFGSAANSVEALTLLALAEEQVIEVGRQKLAPLETIFDLTLNAEVPDGEFRVDLDNERVSISVGQKTLDDIAGMRNSRDGRAMLLSAVYLPALIGVLQYLKDDSAPFEGKRWHAVLTAKLSANNIDLTSCDPLEQAQKLLKAPFRRTAEAYRREQN